MTRITSRGKEWQDRIIFLELLHHHHHPGHTVTVRIFQYFGLTEAPGNNFNERLDKCVSMCGVCVANFI